MEGPSILAEIFGDKDIENADVGYMMREARDSLVDKYRNAVTLNIREIDAIIRAVFTHRRLDADENLPNTNKKPDQVVSPGLIRFVRLGSSTSGFLTVPYIWIWMLAKSDAKSLLPHWLFDDYDEHMSKWDKTLPAGSLSWENFERFMTFFRCMKSSTLNEGTVTVLHDHL